jgi:hypothetical protein
MTSKVALRAVGCWLAVAAPVGVLNTYVLAPRGLSVLGEGVILVWGSVLLFRAYEAQRGDRR